LTVFIVLTIFMVFTDFMALAFYDALQFPAHHSLTHKKRKKEFEGSSF